MDNVVNGSFTSPLANANLRTDRDVDSAGLLSSVYNGVSGWNAALTLLLTLVIYDQCEILSLSSLSLVSREC